MTTSTTRRVALISGANRGIGLAIASRLREEGWSLSLGVRSPARLPRALAVPEVLAAPFDATDRASERRWVEATVERFGRIDAIVANAGIMIAKSVIDVADDEIDALFEVNVKSPLRLARAAWPHLAATGRGRIVTIVSLSGKRVKTARSASYAMSKFAALALTHGLRHAGFAAGIRATALCPGFVATEMGAALTDIDLRRATQPSEIARIVSLLLDLPNSASIAEIPVSWTLEDSY
jgi:NAD(P)-dependent dehydrogenase (short-subunit alcohol dehydrogenase family)